jgi:hypothetical protein
MPRRRQRTRSRRVSDAVWEQLRASIHAGYPWIHIDGFYELLGLVRGSWFPFCHIIDETDEEAQRALWEELQADILAEHARRRPGDRPWAWWKWDAPELRRVIGRDRDEDEGNGHDDGRLPAAEDPNLPECAKGTYFGGPRVYDGYAYETQREYLERLSMLTDDEKALFEKYGDIVFARISSGMFGKCEICWTDAREAAKKIDFDLDAHALPYDTFWLPETLIVDCEHREEWSRESIFTADYY